MKLIVALLINCLAVTAATPQNSQRSFSANRTLLKKCLGERISASHFSGNVLVGDGEQVMLDESYGAGIKWGTKFYIASISKQFTAVAILKLEERRRLKTDDEIGKYFHPVPPDKAHITIHQLLTHTSGLPQDYAADGMTDRASAIRAVLAGRLKSKPGTDFNYSNDGYSLLAALIEIASGISFEKFVRGEVLAPAGLSQTGFWGEPVRTGAPIAPVQKKIDTRPNWGFRGATGMFSTTRDLYQWTRALLANRVLTKQETERMMRPYVTTSAGAYGYGWFRSMTKNGVNDLWTAGYEDYGHNGVIHVYGNGVISVVLTNSGDLNGKPARAVAADAIENVLIDGQVACGSRS